MHRTPKLGSEAKDRQRERREASTDGRRAERTGTVRRVELDDASRFGAPDLFAPLALEERLRRCQSDGEVKGMFFAGVADEASRRAGRRVGRPRYVPFRGYALGEWLTFLPEAAEAAFPGVHPREGMRRFGRGAFDVFTSGTAGRVLFSMAGRNPVMAAGLTGRAFDVIGSHGRVEVVENVEGRAVYRLTNMWDYIQGWHVGVYEGGMKALGMDGEVRVHATDLCDAEIEIRYTRR